MRKFDKETKVNKRLSMDYEELSWKMSQSGLDISGSTESLFKQGAHSPSPSEKGSPHIRRKSNRSPSSHSESGGSVTYRRSVSTSATFTKEKEVTKNRSMTRSQNDADSLYADGELSTCSTDSGLVSSLVDVTSMSQSLPVTFHTNSLHAPVSGHIQRSHTPSPPPAPNGDVFSQHSPRSSQVNGQGNTNIPNIHHRGQVKRNRTFSAGSQKNEIINENDNMCESQDENSERSTTSLQWDHESMGTPDIKSMESSQNSDITDSSLEQTCTPEFWSNENTSMDSSKEFSHSSSSDTVINEEPTIAE